MRWTLLAWILVPAEQMPSRSLRAAAAPVGLFTDCFIPAKSKQVQVNPGIVVVSERSSEVVLVLTA